MALDGVTLAHLVGELAPQLCGARIDKIFQPEKNEVHFLLRKQTTTRLLFNAGATSARLHLTPESRANPPAPPMFCMILRKYLEGGRITALRQNGLERVVTLDIQNYNDRGDLVTLHLHLEIMGKHSNLILVDPVSGMILDGLKRYSHALSRYREVLPGRPYLAPPGQGKLAPARDEEQWQKALLANSLDHLLPAALLDSFAGISPELAREIVLRADLSMETPLQMCGAIDLSRLFRAYYTLCIPESNYDRKPTDDSGFKTAVDSRLKPTDDSRFTTEHDSRFKTADGSELKPCIYYSPDKTRPAAFTFTPFQQYQDFPQKKFSTLNEAITEFYRYKTEQNSLDAKRGSLRKIVRDRHTHFRKKLQIYEEAETKAASALSYQKWGELLTANLYNIPEGAREISVQDYYSPAGETLTIPLDPQMSPIDNAQHYYKLYNKAKATLLNTAPLRETALSEIQYLGSLLVSLDQVTTSGELEEIRRELSAQNYLRDISVEENRSRPTKKGRLKPSVKKSGSGPGEAVQPRIFRSSQGRIIYVGKNNAQNDWLTMRKGKPGDLWLHVKTIPGSHVLVPLNEGEEFPDDATLVEAAMLAVYYSQARGSSQVPVDYTHIKHVKKPNAAKPGMVIYEQNWTLYITPDQELLKRLLAGEEQ